MNKSASRTLEILEFFAQSDGKTVGVSEISRLLKLPKSSTYALLQTMKEQGYLEESDGESKGFKLGIHAYRLGTILTKKLDVRELIGRILRKLQEKTGLTALYALRDDDMLRFIQKQEQEGMNLPIREGERYPLHLTAAGKAILASYADETVIDIIGCGCYETYTQASLGTWHQLYQELQKIRRNGYAVEAFECDPYIYAVAVPILSTSGIASAALELAMYREESERMDISKLIEYVRECADELTALDPA